MKMEWGEGQVKGGSPAAPANDSSHEKGEDICRLIQNYGYEEPCTDVSHLYLT